MCARNTLLPAQQAIKVNNDFSAALVLLVVLVDADGVDPRH